MNKREFTGRLSNSTKIDEDTVLKFLTLVEESTNPFENDEEKVLQKVLDGCDLDRETANRLYEEYRYILKTEIKKKIIHPFGNK